MSFRKLKIPRHHKKAAKNAAATNLAVSASVSSDGKQLPMQAEHLLEDAKNVELFEDVLTQINAFYDLAFADDKEVLPIFVGVTPRGLLVELSAVRDISHAGEPVAANDLNVFTYLIGTELSAGVKPRDIVEINMVKGQEQIRLLDADHPMPDTADGKAVASWRFTEAETIQLQTMGIYEVQPDNYNQISYGHGVEALGGTKEVILPLQHFAAELL